LPLPNLKDTASALIPRQDTQPILYLISHREPHPHIVRYCQRENLAIKQVVSPDSLEEALLTGLPQAIAWDSGDTSQNISQVVQRLYAYPQLREVPFLLFDFANSAESQANETSVLLKPTRTKSLLSLITASYFPDEKGIILVVDDDPDARQFYARVISNYLPRYTIQTAANGIEAVAAMNAIVPNLVILDLVMPEMDGFAVTQWMRTHTNTQHVPAIILSGKMLTFDDVQRLRSFRKITFQTKRILSEDELASAFQQVLVKQTFPSPETSAIVKQSVVFIHNHYDESFTRSDIAQAVGVSENYLTQVFHDEMGIALWEYLNRYRITRSKDLLIQTGMTIAQVATVTY
jgi:CheY-like chemotaxis protein